MLKIFSILGELFSEPEPTGVDTDTAWIADPLRHPDIARMDARELGDLPFPAAIVRLTPKLSANACRL